MKSISPVTGRRINYQNGDHLIAAVAHLVEAAQLLDVADPAAASRALLLGERVRKRVDQIDVLKDLARHCAALGEINAAVRWGRKAEQLA